ncbi:MAG: hypothetical protein JWP81_3795 [Ferruginibacter sp.]|nr:hypothetical protein [Ferruginibacter sp.]
MKRSLLMLGFCIAFYTMQAQNVAKKQPGWMDQFHSFNTLQVLNGSTTTSLAVNTVNGFQFGKLFTGVGTGFDYYYHTSVPLFLEARFDLLNRKGKMQLFGDGGINFPFSAQNKKLEYNAGDYRTGSLYGAGIDYLVMIKKEAIILGAAFSNKTIVQMRDNYVWNPIMNTSENIPTKDKYSLNRIAIRVGWMF